VLFLRRIFGGKKEDKTPERQQLSLDELRRQLIELVESRVKSSEDEMRRIIGEIVSCKDEVLKAVDALGAAKPDSDVHSGLLKAGESARKLLSDKLRRALLELRFPSDLSASSLREFNQRLAKSINLTTDAMMSHRRYVGAVFEKQFREVVFSLDRMQYLSKQMHGAGERVLQEVRRIEALIADVDSTISTKSSFDEEVRKAAELEARLSSIDLRTAQERKKLEELRSSEGYRLEVMMREEAGAAEGELRKFKNEVMSMFSEISRPLKKIMKLVESGSHQMDREKIQVLELCLEDPIQLFSDDTLLDRTSELMDEVTRLIEDRKIELEEKERRKKMEKVRKLAASMGELKGRLDALAVRSMEYSKRERPAERAEEGIQRVLRELEEERRKIASELEPLRKKIGKLDEEIRRKLEAISAAAQPLLGKTIELTS